MQIVKEKGRRIWKIYDNGKYHSFDRYAARVNFVLKRAESLLKERNAAEAQNAVQNANISLLLKKLQEYEAQK